FGLRSPIAITDRLVAERRRRLGLAKPHRLSAQVAVIASSKDTARLWFKIASVAIRREQASPSRCELERDRLSRGVATWKQPGRGLFHGRACSSFRIAALSTSSTSGATFDEAGLVS